MMNAQYKDIARSIRNGWKRFLSIVIITALGVAMVTGLYASCLGMYYSANSYFESQNLFDIRILSTLGLTEDDLTSLSQIPGVLSVSGEYSEIVSTDVSGTGKTVEVKTLSAQGINMPFVISGVLPSSPGEVAVTQEYLDESGKSIGDTLLLKIAKDNTGEDSTASDNDLLKNADISIDSDKSTSSIIRESYTITALVSNPLDITSKELGSMLRSVSVADFAFYITANNVEINIYTSAYIRLSEAREFASYSVGYDNAVQSALSYIDTNIKEDRENARYYELINEGRTALNDAETEMQKKLSEAETSFSDAWAEIFDGRKALSDGYATLSREETGAASQIGAARAELEKARQRLKQAENEISDGEARLSVGENELNEKAAVIESSRNAIEDRRQELSDGQTKLYEAQLVIDSKRYELETEISGFKATLGSAWPDSQWNALVDRSSALTLAGTDAGALSESAALEIAALSQALDTYFHNVDSKGQLEDLREGLVRTGLSLGSINARQQMLSEQISIFSLQKKEALAQIYEAEAQLINAEAEIAAARDVLANNKAELAAARAELDRGLAELESAEASLNNREKKAANEIARARTEISEGLDKLADGEEELVESQKDFNEKSAHAMEELSKAKKELAELDGAKWYLQDRSSLESYSSLDSDLSSIESVGRIFPLLFLLVAVLMSLTTMTRMVEEERGLIGTYISLGFDNWEIYRKYLSFALGASLLGGILGDIIGFILMPKFLFVVLESLYTLPHYYLRFDFFYGLGGVFIFMAVIVGSTALACKRSFIKMPAALMRPNAPRAGSRVFLERIRPLWSRLGFLNKVTVRNLFRYKKRLLMTVGGIAGCTALILCGFAIKDSIADLEPKQYEAVYKYDLMLVFNERLMDEIYPELLNDKNIEDQLTLRIESVKAINADSKSEKAQLIVIPDGVGLEDYISLKDKSGKKASPDSDGILLTQNAAEMLSVAPGDKLYLQDMTLTQHEVVLTGIVKNYLGNNIYMTQGLYTSLFHEYSSNGMLARLSDTCSDQPHYAETLLKHDAVLSAISTEAARDAYGFDLIDAVILLIVCMAGGLAFVVLFTLSNTNISERERELATIKVLGFYDNEVHQYVNKETFILTVTGIILGLPLGRAVSELLTVVLKMPSLYFAVYVEPASYLYAALLTLCFATVVGLFTNRALNRINMVEALKSVE